MIDSVFHIFYALSDFFCLAVLSITEREVIKSSTILD